MAPAWAVGPSEVSYDGVLNEAGANRRRCDALLGATSRVSGRAAVAAIMHVDPDALIGLGAISGRDHRLIVCRLNVFVSARRATSSFHTAVSLWVTSRVTANGRRQATGAGWRISGDLEL